MSVQLPPNSTGSVVGTLTSGGKEYQENIISDGVTPTQLASVLLPGAAESLEIAALRVSSHPLDSSKTSYASCTVARSPGTAATTAIASLVGSASKVVKLTKLIVSFTEATAAAMYNLRLMKTSAAATGGTAQAETIVPLKTTNAAATAVANFFTAAPTAGTPVGAIKSLKLFGSITGTIAVTDRFVVEFGDKAQCPTLVGVAETLELNINGATPANAGSWDVTWEWTEE
jgi:hypothetical protein